jgi:aarF domain-containing kinase
MGGADNGLMINAKVMKEELADECNCTWEQASMRSFGSLERLGGDARFNVPCM